MIKRPKTHLESRVPIAAGVVAAVILIGACASVPRAPTETLQEARVAIADAERADAGRYAAAELSEARKQLAAADLSVKEERMLMAARFAEESRVQAQLASAKTQAVMAKAVNDETKHSTDTLIEEMKRTSGDKT